MRLHPNGAHTGSAAAVRNAERLVQVHVTHVAANFGRLDDAHQSIEVCPIKIDLTAIVMDDAADFLDGFFEHTVC